MQQRIGESVLKNYDDFYTWQTLLSNEIIGHSDGAVSCMILFDGIGCEMMAKDEKLAAYQNIYQVLAKLKGCSAEFHLWREKDDAPAKAYLDKNKKIIRGRKLAEFVKDEIAQHLSQSSRTNQTALVLYRRSDDGLIDTLLNRKSSKRQLLNAQSLGNAAMRLAKYLPGASLASAGQYFDKVLQSFWRKGYQRGYRYPFDFRYDIAEQVIVDAPKIENGLVVVDGCHTKVLLLYLYPDASAGWFLNLADIACDMHVSQIIVPTDARKYVDEQTKASGQDQAAISEEKGAKYTEKKISDREAFTSMVAEYNLGIFKTAYLIHLHGEPDQITAMAEAIESWADDGGGQVRMNGNLQAHFFRAAQPGCGHCSAFLRADHTWQVGNMAPVVTFDRGMIGAESLRLSTSGQLTGFSVLDHKVSHGFTVAKTGAGKGVDKGAEILETYPFGLDWYIIEAGLSYAWIVEGFGGQYVCYDAEKHILNPFADFDLTDPTSQTPLDVSLCTATVNAISFLLTDGKVELNVHQAAAAQKALQQLYKKPIEGKKAPRLDHYLNALQTCSYDNDEQKDAAEVMMSNLDSFLSTSVGERFKHDNNITIRPGICGIDLKKIVNMDKKLMEFCLTSIALRYSQLAFYKSDTPSRVLLDELHEFVEVSPLVMGNLCRQISRMGRKDGASLDLVTQGLKEMKVLDSEVIGSTALRNLLYRNKDWDEMGEILGVPEAALQRWKSYPVPHQLPFRPGLRGVNGKYYDLHLTFPEFVLDITSTDPGDLALKQQISEDTQDVFERVKMLRDMRLKN
ncbi:MAG: hypothetical protein GY874_12965 [Desulfobacteraceae bacterium]|nr:hypothetical protein [Desulfobacteraceae bacterium]